MTEFLASLEGRGLEGAESVAASWEWSAMGSYEGKKTAEGTNAMDRSRQEFLSLRETQNVREQMNERKEGKKKEGKPTKRECDS